MESLILHDLTLLGPLAYVIIFIGMIFEGDIFLFTAFYLAHQRAIDLGDTFFAAMAGALIGDFLWYILGPRLNKYPFFQKISHRVTGPLDAFINKRPGLVIPISKFMYGFHRPILLRTKSAGISSPRFLKIDVFSILLWIFVIGGMSYVFSASVFLLKKYIRFAEIGLVAAVGTFILIFYLLSRLFERYFKKEEEKSV